MPARAFVFGILGVLPVFLAGCSDSFLERVQSTSDNLDQWFAGKGVAPQEAGPAGSPESGAAEAAYKQGLARKREGAAAEAAARFHEAAEAGHAGAAYELAEAYRQGDGVARDDEAATKWLNAAAERGEPRAQYMLGAAYYGGLGVAQDDARAVHWLGQAATGGHDRAQFLLAEAFANGRGVQADMAWAARWYGKAARQGHARAQLVYGLLLAKGNGLPADPAQGYTWLTLAAGNGEAYAAAALEELAPRLDPAERAAAEDAAARFRPRPNTRFADPPTVMYVQYRLSRLGFETGGVDGLMGPKTRDGIHAYQRARGRPSNGRLTPDLLTALLQEPKA